MPFILESWDLSKARSVLPKFREMEWAEIRKNPVGRTKVTAFYVYGKARDSQTKGSKYFVDIKRPQTVDEFHRFILLGSNKSSELGCHFTKDQRESRRIFQYFTHLSPGTAVALLCPKFDGELGNSGNMLLSLQEPLIPLADEYDGILPLTVTPKWTGQPGEYNFFRFTTNSLVLDNIDMRKDGCPGHLCDGQTEPGVKCPCISNSSATEWTVNCEVIADELQSARSHNERVVLRSCSILQMLLNNEVADLSSVDPFELDDFVQSFVKYFNEGPSTFWNVSGWYRIPTEHDEMLIDPRVFHVIKLEKKGDEDSSLVICRNEMLGKFPQTTPRTPSPPAKRSKSIKT